MTTTPKPLEVNLAHARVLARRLRIGAGLMRRSFITDSAADDVATHLELMSDELEHLREVQTIAGGVACLDALDFGMTFMLTLVQDALKREETLVDFALQLDRHPSPDEVFDQWLQDYLARQAKKL